MRRVINVVNQGLLKAHSGACRTLTSVIRNVCNTDVGNRQDGNSAVTNDQFGNTLS